MRDCVSLHLKTPWEEMWSYKDITIPNIQNEKNLHHTYVIFSVFGRVSCRKQDKCPAGPQALTCPLFHVQETDLECGCHF